MRNLLVISSLQVLLLQLLFVNLLSPLLLLFKRVFQSHHIPNVQNVFNLDVGSSRVQSCLCSVKTGLEVKQVVRLVFALKVQLLLHWRTPVVREGGVWFGLGVERLFYSELPSLDVILDRFVHIPVNSGRLVLQTVNSRSSLESRIYRLRQILWLPRLATVTLWRQRLRPLHDLRHELCHVFWAAISFLQKSCLNFIAISCTDDFVEHTASL